MSSTEFVVDRRDIRFVQKEFLDLKRLAELDAFSHVGEDEIDMVLDEGAALIEEVVAPLNKSGDREGSRLENGKVVTPAGFKEAWQSCSEAGWLSIDADPKYSGQGLPLSVALSFQESMYGANPAFYTTMMLTAGAARLIATFGDDAQKDAYCENMLSGRWGGTMCLSEPQAGSAVGDILTSAEPAPDGSHYKIKGTKCWISGGDHDFTDNIVHLVLARVKGAPAGTRGISLFIVPKYRLDGSGNPAEENNVTTVSLEHKLGIKASPTCVLEFGDNDNCHGYLLEAENRGMSQMFKLMNEARLVVAYQGLGAAAGAYGNALAYAQERIQGVPVDQGKNPDAERTAIVHHPDVRNMLMTMKALLEGSRGLIYSLAYYHDMANHGPQAQRGYYQDLVEILTPVAKNTGADQGFEVVRLGVQVLGGVGFTEECPLAQHLRDTKIASIYEGTTGIQALDLVTRKLRLREGGMFQTMLEEIGGLAPDQAGSPTLGEAISRWRDGVGIMRKTVMNLLETSQQHGPREAVFNATDVTVLFGDVMCCHYLLIMALKAEQTMDGLCNGGDAASLARENEEVRFYFNKIKTAEHYAFQILPRVHAIAAKVESGNFAALEAVL